jgi:ELWxxDGT repeat protein/VCBS repeat-containing protein
MPLRGYFAMPDIAGNSLNTATRLNLTSSVQTFSDTATQTANDFYRLNLAYRSSLNLSLTGLNSDVNVTLLDRSGNPLTLNGILQGSANPGNFSEAIVTKLDAGIYYIRVAPGNAIPTVDYNLNLATTTSLSTDILWRNYATGQNTVWQIERTEFSGAIPIIPAEDVNWTIGGTGDFNADGEIDILWRNYGSGRNTVWLMESTNFNTSVPIPEVTDLNWVIQSADDFNGDGKPDIVWRNYATGQNTVWLMDGTNFLTAVPLIQVEDLNWMIGGTGDFNGDGKNDLLWRNEATGQNTVWLMDGTNFLTAVPLIEVTDLNWRIQGTGDFNADGKRDILWRNYGTGQNTIWLMDGLVFSGAVSLIPTVDLNWQAKAPYTRVNEPALPDLSGNNLAAAFNLGRNLTGAATYREAIAADEVEDFYRFEINQRSNANFALSELTANLDLQLLNQNGTVLQTSNQANTIAESLSRLLDPGIYYIRAFSNGGSGSGYQLDVRLDNLPTLAINTGLTLSEGESRTLSSTVLQVTDDDSATTQLSYTLNSLPTQGGLSLNNAVLAVNGVFTQADLEAGNRLRYQHNGSESTTDSFSFTVLDRSGGTVSSSFTFAILPVNDRPVVTVPGGRSADQNANAPITGISIADPDAAAGEITATLTALNGVLSLADLNGLTFTQGDGTSDAAIIFRGTLTAVNAALSTINYRSNPTFVGTDTVTVRVDDNGNTGGGNLFDSQSFSVQVTAPNRPPVITLPTTVTAIEDISQTIAGISISDPDAGGGIVTVSLTVLNGTISLSSTAGVTLVTGTGTGDRNITFQAPLAIANTALNNLSYLGRQNFSGTDSLLISVSDNGNTGNGAPGSDAEILQITVNPANDPPVLTVPGAQQVNEDLATTIPGISVVDVDGGTTDVTVTLTAVNGVLSLRSLTGLSFTTGTGTRNNTMTFRGSLAAVNAALNDLSYQSNANFSGTDTLNVTVSDNAGSGSLSDTETIAINVLAVNDAPVITLPTPPSANTNTNTPIPGIGVSDPDAGGGGAIASISAANGLLSLQLNSGVSFIQGTTNDSSRLTLQGTMAAINTALATLTYRSIPRFIGFDPITISVNDQGNTGIGAPLTTTAELFVAVGGVVNTPPLALNDTYSVNEDTLLSGETVLTNDTDPDTGTAPPSAQLLAAPTNAATFTFNPNGTFSYTPRANFNGTDSFTYAARDALGGVSGAATVTIAVNAVNDAPIANPDTYSTSEDTPLTGSTVLVNDTDPDGAPPTSAQLVTAPSNAASFTLNPDGTFNYTPRANFNGTDSFTYSARDAAGGVSAPTGVTIVVIGTADPLIANPDTYSTNEDTVLPGASVLTNDTDADSGGTPTSAQLVTAPVNAASFTLNPNGTFSYTPSANFNGTDSFVYRAQNATGGLSNPATATIVVNPVNDAPVAGNDSFSLSRNGTLNLLPARDLLINDTDVDGDSLTVIPNQPLRGGTLTANPDGSFTYQPQAGFAGTDSFTYRLNDGTIDAATLGTVILNVITTNAAPVADADSYTVRANGVLTVPATNGVLIGDTDADGNSLTARLGAGSANGGTLSLQPDGSFTYTPRTGFVGTDSFTYFANDGTIDSATSATVTLVVTNTAPVAVNDSYTTQRNTALTVVPSQGILVSDTDAEGNSLTATTFSAPASGTLTPNADGSFVYTPATDVVGTVSFTYRANDGIVDSANLGTVTIVVAPTNRPPVVLNETYDVARNTSVTIAARGVLTNDSDPDGNSLTATVATNPIRGTVALNPDGSFTYNPQAGTSGTDSFIYQVSDGITSTLGTATLNVTVGSNTAPLLRNDIYPNVIAGRPFTSDSISSVRANDTDAESDPISVSLVTPPNPDQGSVVLNSDGTFTFTPQIGFQGTASFTYKGNDGVIDAVNTATVFLIVSTNTAPIANNDTYAVSPTGRAVDQLFGVLNNDIDADTPSLPPPTAVLVTNVSNGTLALNPNGSFNYIPNAGTTTDSFTYRANDGVADSANTATVFLSVVANTPPVVRNDNYTVSAGRPTTIDEFQGILRSNDTDAENDRLTARSTSNPTGTLVLNPNGSFTYTPIATSGIDSFTYVANDGIVDSTTTATVFLTIVSNTAPIALPDNYQANINTPLTITAARGVLANDTDAENNTLTVNPVGLPRNGTLSLDRTGAFTYTPNQNFASTDTFVYTVSDGLLSSQGTATITVGPNVAPIANPDSYTVNRNGILNIAAANGVLTNDIDVGTLTASVVTNPNPANGALTLNADGSFTYRPNASFTGTIDSFVYSASDGALSASATVTISLRTTSAPPTVVGDSYSVNANGVLTVPLATGVLQNDTDPDGDTLRALTGTVAPTRGTLLLNENGSFTYTPSANVVGTDSFTYQASDGINAIAATVTVVIGAVNNAPTVTVPGAQVGIQNTDLVIPSGLSITDVDAGSNPIAVQLTATSGNLTLSSTTGLTVTGNGTTNVQITGTIANINTALTNLRYRPVSSTFTGADVIAVTANDQGNTGGATPTPRTGTGSITVNVSGGATILRDINPVPNAGGTNGSNPMNFTAAGNIVYFTANDGQNGTELWRSDGTTANTTLVANINTDLNSSSSPSNLTVVGNRLFFTADNGVNGVELWSLDLTTGTTPALVRDIAPLSSDANPANLVNFNGTLFFRANDGTGTALWKSDGTIAGTVRVGSGFSQPGGLTVVGNTLYFTAANGNQLWRTDGTDAGTRLVSNVAAGATIANLTAIGNTLFFTATDSNGTELWRSDGTGTGTTRSDLNPGAGSSNPSNLVNFNGTLYFFANDGTGNALWRSTATEAPTKVQAVSSTGQPPRSLTVVGSTLFFVNDVGTAAIPNLQLWRSDGSTVSLVSDINPTGNDNPASLTNFNGSLLFTANDGTGTKLWRSDGTATGTIAISAVFPGAVPTNLTPVGSRLFFAANNGTSGVEPWVL